MEASSTTVLLVNVNFKTQSLPITPDPKRSHIRRVRAHLGINNFRNYLQRVDVEVGGRSYPSAWSTDQSLLVYLFYFSK
jgi:hypothetical protein